MNAWIAVNAELRQRLQIHGIHLLGLCHELLARQQRRFPDGRTFQDGAEEILAYEIGGSVAVRRPIGNRCAAKIAVGALAQIALADRHIEPQHYGVIEFSAIATFGRRDRPGLDLAFERFRCQ